MDAPLSRKARSILGKHKLNGTLVELLEYKEGDEVSVLKMPSGEIVSVRPSDSVVGQGRVRFRKVVLRRKSKSVRSNPSKRDSEERIHSAVNNRHGRNKYKAR